jgi:Holliday junction resolvase RusA-like endonuclease
MKPKNKLTRGEYLNERNQVYNSRKGSSLYKDNSKSKVRMQTVRKVQGVVSKSENVLHSGPFKIEVEIYGKCRGDIDNVLKGVLDSLNGIAYIDDKQCIDARVKLCKC